jgi:Acyl-CoA synthetases (AMP-forming)/AMP-acid ligases II
MKIAIKLSDLINMKFNLLRVNLESLIIDKDFEELTRDLLNDETTITIICDIDVNFEKNPAIRDYLKNIIVNLLKKYNIHYSNLIFSSDDVVDICDRNTIDFFISRDLNDISKFENEEYVQAIALSNDCSILDAKDKVLELIEESNVLYKNPNPKTGILSVDKPHLESYRVGDFKRYERLAKKANKSQLQTFKDNNADYLDDVGLSWEGTEYTFREIFSNIDKYAKAMSKTVEENDVVGICGANVPSSVFAIFASQDIGAIPSLYHPYVPEETFKKLIDLEQPKVLFLLQLEKTWWNIKNAIKNSSIKEIVSIPITNGAPLKLKIGATILQSRAFTIFSTIKSVLKNEITISDGFQNCVKPNFRKDINKHSLTININSFLKRTKKLKTFKKSTNEIATLIHTSGTAGNPKTAQISHQQISLNQAAFEATGRHFKRGDTVLVVSPLFHILGLNNCLSVPLRLGGRLILVSKYDAESFHKYFENEDINVLFCVPTIVRDMKKNFEKYPDGVFSKLKACFIGGEEINQEEMLELEQFFKTRASNPDTVRIGQALGATETTCCMTITADNGENITTLGKTLINGEAKIIDPDTKLEKKANEIGELYYSGPMFSGYYKNDELTNEVLEIDETGKKWIHLGDYCTISENGDISFNYRTDDMIKIDGEKVNLDQIRRIFYETACIENLALFPIENENGKVKIGALAVLKKGIIVDQRALQEKIMTNCGLKLGAKYRPDFIEYVTELPKTLNLKTDMKAIRKLYDTEACISDKLQYKVLEK